MDKAPSAFSQESTGRFGSSQRLAQSVAHRRVLQRAARQVSSVADWGWLRDRTGSTAERHARELKNASHNAA
jgi:hypothetical protein